MRFIYFRQTITHSTSFPMPSICLYPLTFGRKSGQNRHSVAETTRKKMAIRAASKRARSRITHCILMDTEVGSREGAAKTRLSGGREEIRTGKITGVPGA